MIKIPPLCYYCRPCVKKYALIIKRLNRKKTVEKNTANFLKICRANDTANFFEHAKILKKT